MDVFTIVIEVRLGSYSVNWSPLLLYCQGKLLLGLREQITHAVSNL